MNYTRKFAVQVLAASLLAVLVTAGCASAHKADLRADFPKQRAQIEQRLKQVLLAAENKDFDRLDSYHYYGPKFTKFVGTYPERLDAATAREEEHRGLGSISGLKMNPQDLKIDIFGNVAVATFLLENTYSRSGEIQHSSQRSTVLFVLEKGSWKIAHEHFSEIKR